MIRNTSPTYRTHLLPITIYYTLGLISLFSSPITLMTKGNVPFVEQVSGENGARL